MFSRLRSRYSKTLTPLSKVLLRLGISPDAVTVIGSAGVIAAALWFFPRGEFLIGSLVVAFFLLGDGLDGTMARLSAKQSAFGGFLDSTLDRAADAAVFSGLVLWAARHDKMMVCAVALLALVTGFLVSYARARAEAAGWQAEVGLMERTDRLVLTLTAIFLVGLGSPEVVLVALLGVVVLGSIVTVGQRIRAAADQAQQRQRPSAD